jgi:hypothetical protein
MLGRAHDGLDAFFGRHHHPDSGGQQQVAHLAFFQHLLAVLAVSQVVVAQHDVIAVATQQGHGLATAVGLVDGARPQVAQAFAQQLAHAGKIVDQQIALVFPLGGIAASVEAGYIHYW